MKQPVPLTKYLDRQLARDTGFLFIASCFVLVKLFDYPLSEAVMLSPLIVGGLILGLYLFVQTCWITMVLIDRLLGLFKFGNHIS